MSDELLHLYEQELSFVRRTGAEFARRYPKIAARLQLDATAVADPHVERLLEGFALLSARVQHRLEQDAPEVSQGLLGLLYPQHVRPLPSMSLVELALDPAQGQLTSGFHVPRGSILMSRPVAGSVCRFRTCYDTTVWPLTVTDAGWMAAHEIRPPLSSGDTPSALRVQLEPLPGLLVSDLELSRLRLHLRAEPAVAATLYELLDQNCVRIVLRDPQQPGVDPVVLPGSSLRATGFDEDQLLLPSTRPSFLAYGLLQEYFALPEKYLFFDLHGLEPVRDRGFTERLEILFLISPFQREERRTSLGHGISASSIRLGCTPIVNLFERTAEPLLMTHRRPEYRLVADARQRTDTGIYSVDEVTGTSPGLSEPVRYLPFHAFRHGTGKAQRELIWHASRRPSNWRGDEGTDVVLSFMDRSTRAAHPDEDVVTARVTCHNRDLPSRLTFGEAGTDFELVDGGPIGRIGVLSQPTRIIEPPLGKPMLWRLLSQLSLNYGSLVDGGAEGLRELLRLHNSGGSGAAEAQIRGIVGVEGAPCHSPIQTEQGLAFARGKRIELTLDEEEFTGSGAYLFAAILERFFGLYASLNSFSILVARSRQRREAIREWPPRSGRKALV
ncbi:MAG TPA: type VI secretion system baseplate subunit TssF [Longimicrobiales bacterium]|nr:type VI secretion system baseplate subunit TssF [Longimicrobiales bacterium]